MRAISVGMLLALIALLPRSACAWGDEGHKIIALIAYQHLAPNVQRQVKQLLSADPDTRTKANIADAATWADSFRDSDRNTSKRRYNLTREWHFVDLELDNPDLASACYGHPRAAAPASAGPAKACVVDRIAAFQSELKALPLDDPERVIALKFVLHFVGDVHQPLHAADQHDRGGNDTKVLFGRHAVGQPLHAFWDTDVVKRLGSAPTMVARPLDQKFGSQCNAWMSGGPSDWAQDTFEVARDTAYHLGQATTKDRNGATVYRLSTEYQLKAVAVAGEQLAKAGCRLAFVLNQALQ